MVQGSDGPELNQFKDSHGSKKDSGIRAGSVRHVLEDFVVVINAEKIALTGRKLADKIYYHHSGYPGGIKAWPAGKLLAKKPEELIRRAVQGMLPKNSLGRQQLRKLKIYSGDKHPHDAQKPHLLEL